MNLICKGINSKFIFHQRFDKEITPQKFQTEMLDSFKSLANIILNNEEIYVKKS